MQAYQSFNEMDNMMNRDRKFTRPVSLPPTVPLKQLPRYFQDVPYAMNSPLNSEQFAVWPPTPRNIGDRSAVSEGPYSFSMPEDGTSSGATSAWEGSVHGTPEQPAVSIGMEIPQTYGSPIESNEWNRPRSGDYSSMLNEDGLGSSYGSNQETGLLGPSAYITRSPAQSDILSLDTNLPRRPSYSETASLSSVDNIPSTTSADLSYNYGDSSATSYDGSYLSDYTQQQHTPLSLPSSITTPLSPVMSVRSAASRGRGSPSPSRGIRFDPYDKSKRWSTGNYYNVDPSLQQLQTPIHTPQSMHSSPTCGPVLPFHTHIPASQPYGVNAYSPYVDNHHGHPHHPQLLSNFCIPSHGPSDHPASHFDQCAEPPNLYASLLEDQIPPPPEDMNPEDPDMKPHEQDLRFEGDLYTPRWVRGHGNKREGWCGICKPGRWLVLKNSAFWYDKSFTHGISAATGQSFHEPRDMRRMDGNPDVWEGLCHSCNDWVPLVSNKKKGTTWFRHAYKCHTHNKVKDAPKRRRESHTKVVAQAFKAEQAKQEY